MIVIENTLYEKCGMSSNLQLQYGLIRRVESILILEVRNLHKTLLLLLLFAMIRSVVKSFKVPDVEVVAARMSNESALTRMTDSTLKKLGQT